VGAGGKAGAGAPGYYEGHDITSWSEHACRVGGEDQLELLWIHYRYRPLAITRLESHRLTEQALIPVTGKPIIHVVCPPPDDPEAAGSCRTWNR